MSNFYVGGSVFIEINAAETEIFWAYNFGEAEYSLMRTRNHGFKKRFPSSDLTVRVDNTPTWNNAKDLIDTELTTNGPDADIFLVFKDSDAVEQIRLKFDVKGYLKDTKDGKQSQLKFRAETWDDTLEKALKDKANINWTEDVEGNAIAQLTPEDCYFHSKAIRKTGKGELNSDLDNTFVFTETGVDDSIFHYIKHGFSVQKVNEFEKYFTYRPIKFYLNPNTEIVPPFSDASFLSNASPKPVEENLLFDLEVTESGPYNIIVDTPTWRYNVPSIGNNTTQRIQDVEIYHYVRIYDINGTNKVDDTAASSINNGLNLQPPQTFPLAFSYNQTYDLEVGDRIYVYTYIYMDHNSLVDDAVENCEYTTTADIPTLDIVADTKVADSREKVYGIYEALDKAVEINTTITNPVRSTFLQSIGGHITNGNLIGGKEVDDEFTPIINPLEYLDSFDAMFNIGWGSELDGSDDVLRVEDAEYFYQSNEIIDISGKELEQYTEEFATDRIWNRAIFTYPDFRDEELNTVDEFITNSEFRLLSQALLRSYDKTSKIKASGYDIEFLRRQALSTDSSAFKEDNSIFYLSTVEDFQFTTIATFSSLDDSITVNKETFNRIQKSPTFGISGSASNDGTYIFRNIQGDPNIEDLGGGSIKIFVTDPIVSSVAESVTVLTFGLIARSDENYETLSGVIDPSSVYNADMSLDKLYLRHSILLNASQNYFTGSDSVINKQYERNGNLTTRFSTVEAPRYDPDRLTYVADQDHLLSESNQFNKLFIPMYARLRVKLTDSELNTIEQAYKGQGVNKYGYITFNSREGVKTGFLQELKGKPREGKYDLKILIRT